MWWVPQLAYGLFPSLLSARGLVRLAVSWPLPAHPVQLA